jgi:uncharacterized membrane protein
MQTTYPDARTRVAQDAGAHVRQTVEDVVALEQRTTADEGTSERAAHLITAFSGSMIFVALHVIWFGLWMLLNAGWLGFPAFDPMPYELLTLTVSLEAIFLSTFVLISQNRQGLRADRRAVVDLEVNVIAEREITKLMTMMSEIHDRLGLKHDHDDEIHQMKEQTVVGELADAAERAEVAVRESNEGDVDSSAEER